MDIRLATASDSDDIWEIFREVISSGDSYVFDPAMRRDDALAYWFQPGTHTYVAELGGEILGTYIFRANQPGLGSHVANGSFMVSSSARGTGVGKLMGHHALVAAKDAGFLAMQFNMVVATNDAAVKLWKQLGFEIIGTLPGVYRHSSLGFVDAHVMFRRL